MATTVQNPYEPFEVDGIVYRRPRGAIYDQQTVRFMFELTDDHSCPADQCFSWWGRDVDRGAD